MGCFPTLCVVLLMEMARWSFSRIIFMRCCSNELLLCASCENINFCAAVEGSLDSCRWVGNLSILGILVPFGASERTGVSVHRAIFVSLPAFVYAPVILLLGDSNA